MRIGSLEIGRLLRAESMFMERRWVLRFLTKRRWAEPFVWPGV